MSRSLAVVVKNAKMPVSCWGRYIRVAVVELEPGFDKEPKMISARAKGVKRVLQTWEKCFVGKTPKCAAAKAVAEAIEWADSEARMGDLVLDFT